MEEDLGRRRIHNLLGIIFSNIDGRFLNSVKDTFNNLHPNQRTQVLNSSFNGYTPLSYALSKRMPGISEYLLRLSVLQGRSEMCEAWKRTRHPLSTAIASSSRLFVALIGNYLVNINESFSGPYTPLVKAIFSGNVGMADTILSFGADINLSCSNETTPLMAAASNDLLRFVLDRDADINQQNNDGLTALHIAISNNNLENIGHLVNSGADVRMCTNQGFMPLMWAAVNGMSEAVKILSRHRKYNEEEKIEAFEALNAFYICSQVRDVDLWSQALTDRGSWFPKVTQILPRYIFDFAIEFSTEAQLQNLLRKPVQLAIQGILVIERTIGIKNSYYIDFLLKTALICKKKKKLQKVRNIIYFLGKHCQEMPASFVATCSSSFRELFEEIAQSKDPVTIVEKGGFYLLEIIADATERMWDLLQEQYRTTPHFEITNYSELFDLFLFMANTMNGIKLLQNYNARFRELVTHLVTVDPRDKNMKSFLHHVIKNSRNQSSGSIELIWLLLESGAEVDSRDYFRHTPLMYALKYFSGVNLEETVSFLLDYGSHPDCRDNEGYPADQYSRWTELQKPESPWRLQCFAADVILDSGIQYRGVLPKILEKFVDMHR